jgi:type VI protein secretion system component VasK
MGRPDGRRLDEREAAVVRTGHFTGMMWALGVAVLGSLAIAFGKAWAMLGMGGLWAPETPMDWMTLTLFLLAVETNVAILAASAAMPDPLEDDEE